MDIHSIIRGEHTYGEIIEFVRARMLEQGSPSVCNDEDCNSDCVYRAPGGKMCAIGQLIPDADYAPNMEGKPAYSLFEVIPWLADEDMGTMIYAPRDDHRKYRIRANDIPNFLDGLQSCHDAAYRDAGSARIDQSYKNQPVEDLGTLWVSYFEKHLECFIARLPEGKLKRVASGAKSETINTRAYP
jgi:hypothetical protein